MVLDEPTNHLDIDSREILEELLLSFTGSILFVSHDRYFIQKIGTRVGEINNQSLNYYEGDYNYYKIMKNRENSNESFTKKVKKERVKKTNKEVQIDHESILLDLDSKIEEIQKQMDTYAYDSDKLNELYKEKTVLENKYEEIL